METGGSFSDQREAVIRSLQELFAHYRIKGMLVFDGRVQMGEESGRDYRSPLEICYTWEGQSADDYIIEKIETSKKANEITVVSDDKRLLSHARSFEANAWDNGEFLQWLKTKDRQKKREKPERVETKKNIDRLLVIFEKRLKDENQQAISKPE